MNKYTWLDYEKKLSDQMQKAEADEVSEIIGHGEYGSFEKIE